MSNVISLDEYRQNVERHSVPMNFTAGATPSVRYLHVLCDEILAYADENNLCALVEGMRFDADGKAYLEIITFNHE